MRRAIRTIALNYVRGLGMGTADIVPGVSGGTIALVVGIYERLVSSVRAGSSAVVALLRFDMMRVRHLLRQVHWDLLLPLGAGIGTAIVIGARYIPALMEEYPVQTQALFFGLILGALVVPWRQIHRRMPVHIVIAVVAAIATFVLVGLPPREVAAPGPLLVFVAAAVAICAMILPGISGSYLLLIMGMYAPTLRALNSRDLFYIAVFCAGAAIGLGLFSRLLEHLLARHHDITMAVLVGMMAGSLRALWPYLNDDRGLLPPPADATVLVPIGLVLIGAVVVIGVLWLGLRAERRDRGAVVGE